MPRRRLKPCLVVARTLDDDGWCAHRRDSGGGLHGFNDECFFYNEKFTEDLKYKVFPSAEKARKFFLDTLNSSGYYKKRFPIVRTKYHIEDYWNRKSAA